MNDKQRHEQIISECTKYLPDPSKCIKNLYAVNFYEMPKPLFRKIENMPINQTLAIHIAYFKLIIDPKNGNRKWVFDKFSESFHISSN